MTSITLLYKTTIPIMTIYRHKFNARRCEEDGIKFSSLLERSYYRYLIQEQKDKRLLFFLRQVPIHLPGNVRYVVDFLEFWAPVDSDQGTVVFTEVKGMMTRDAEIKIKQAQEIYGIEINLVRKMNFK